MATMKLTAVLLLLSVTLVSGRCLHAERLFPKKDSAIRLRGGTVYQFVGFPRGSGYRFIIHAHSLQGLSDMLSSLEDAGTSSSEHDVPAQAIPDTDQATVVGQDVQMMNAFNEPDPAAKEDVPVERVGVESAAGAAQDLDGLFVEEQAQQAVRNARTTLAVLYPFLFSTEFSSHMDRLMDARTRAFNDARMRALSHIRNAYLPFHREEEEEDGASALGAGAATGSVMTLADSSALERAFPAVEEEPRAEEGVVVVEDGFKNSVREAWEGARDYTLDSWTSVVKALNYAGRWYSNASSEAIVAAAVIALQAFLLVSTFVIMAAVISSRIWNQEEPTAIILSAQNSPNVQAPLLSDRSDSEYSSDEEDGKPAAKYQPPKIES